MTMTTLDKQWHEYYEALSDEARQAIDMAAAAVQKEFRNAGFSASNSDPAEAMVASLARYLSESAVTAA